MASIMAAAFGRWAMVSGLAEIVHAAATAGLSATKVSGALPAIRMHSAPKIVALRGEKIGQMMGAWPQSSAEAAAFRG